MNEQRFSSEHAEVFGLMYNLYHAGMSIDGVIEKGYEFMLVQGTRSRAEMLHASEAVRWVADRIGVSLDQQKAQSEQASPYLRREEG